MTETGPCVLIKLSSFSISRVPVTRVRRRCSRNTKWIPRLRFRLAVSAAVDREAIARLVYQGRGSALWGLVAPRQPEWGRKAAASATVARTRRISSRKPVFSWGQCRNGESSLLDSDGSQWNFPSLPVLRTRPRENDGARPGRSEAALECAWQVVPLEFRSCLDRRHAVERIRRLRAGIASLDADPNLTLTSGYPAVNTSWNPSQAHPAQSGKEKSIVVRFSDVRAKFR